MVQDQAESGGHWKPKGPDPAVIEGLWKIVDERLGSYIDRRTPRQFDPHDVRIETVLRAFLNAGALPPMPERVAYLARIAANVIHDMSSAHASHEDRRHHRATAEEERGDRLAAEELIAKCLMLLEGRQRQLFVWRYVDRLTDSECARRRGCSLAALWQAVSRMHKRLRKRLGARLPLFFLCVLSDKTLQEVF